MVRCTSKRPTSNQGHANAVERALEGTVGLAARPTVGLVETLELLPENSFKHPTPHARERDPYKLIPSSPPRSPGVEFMMGYSCTL